MFHHKFISVLGKAFRFYAGLALIVLVFQFVGLIMYYLNVWPGIRESLSAGLISFITIAIFLMLIRSLIWIWIYWSGAQVFFTLNREGESPKFLDQLIPRFKTLTRFLVVSCILDLCFVPIIFMSDSFHHFPISALWLGIADLAIILLPQTFGVGSIVLAFLAHQYGNLLKERSQMKKDLELTI